MRVNSPGAPGGGGGEGDAGDAAGGVPAVGRSGVMIRFRRARGRPVRSNDQVPEIACRRSRGRRGRCRFRNGRYRGLEHPRKLARPRWCRLRCGRWQPRGHWKRSREVARRRGGRRCRRRSRLRHRQRRGLKSAREIPRPRRLGRRRRPHRLEQLRKRVAARPRRRRRRRCRRRRGHSPGRSRAVQPGFQRFKPRRQLGDHVGRAFVIPDIDDDLAGLRGRLPRAFDQRHRFRSLAGCEQVHLDQPPGGNLTAAEDADAVSPEDLQQFIFLIEVHDGLAFCPTTGAPRIATAYPTSYGRVYSCAKRWRRLRVAVRREWAANGGVPDELTL